MADEDENDMDYPSGYEKSRVAPARLGFEDLVSGLLPARLGLESAVSGMVNWLAHETLHIPVSHEDFPHLC